MIVSRKSELSNKPSHSRRSFEEHKSLRRTGIELPNLELDKSTVQYEENIDFYNPDGCEAQGNSLRHSEQNCFNPVSRQVRWPERPNTEYIKFYEKIPSCWVVAHQYLYSISTSASLICAKALLKSRARIRDSIEILAREKIKLIRACSNKLLSR